MSEDLKELTAEIVAAYVGNNNVALADLPNLINATYAALTSAGQPTEEAVPPPKKLTPGEIRKSITPDAIICLEDGRKFKSLKRHLQTKYNLSPDEYRKKWGLAKDYPMVAPAYAEARSKLAKAMGLGASGRSSAVIEPPKAAKTAKAPKTTKATKATAPS